MTEKGPSIPKSLVASPVAQFVLFVFTIIYVLSPVDVIPDILPVIGWLDDLAVFITQISAMVMYFREKRRQFVARQQSQAAQGEGGSNGR